MSDDLQTFPCDPDAEKQVLASLMFIEPTKFQEVPTRSDLFWLARNRFVFEVMAEMNVNDVPIDMVTLWNHCQSSERQEKAQVDRVYVTEIFRAFVAHGNTRYYCEILEEKHKRRQLIIAATKAIELARQMEVPIDETITQTQTRISIVEEEADNECVTDKALAILEAQLVERETGKAVHGLITGVPAWDDSLRGIFPGDMQLIGARPKVGKTAAIETAMQTQIELGIPVLCFQRDTRIATMLGRMACRTARVVYEDFLFGVSTTKQNQRVRNALQDLKKAASLIRLYNPARLTAADLHSIVIREMRKSKVKVWYLDHFQTLQYGNKLITEGLTQASMSLRRTINDTGIPGVIIAQVSKEADKSGRPNSGQFKWCDQLFSDADKIVLMWSEVDPKMLAPDERQLINWTVDNSRTGAPSDNRMKFHRELLTFESEAMPG